MKHHIRCRLRSWLGYPVPSKYVQQPTSISSAIGGYLLLEYIDERDGQMLSSTWEAGRANPKLRQNLYRGISRILLSLAQQSFHKIGSLTINDEGLCVGEPPPYNGYPDVGERGNSRSDPKEPHIQHRRLIRQ